MMIPRLNQCFICRRWVPEEVMNPVEVPDQGCTYIRKLICPFCMHPISEEIQKQRGEGGGIVNRERKMREGRKKFYGQERTRKGKGKLLTRGEGKSMQPGKIVNSASFYETK